MAADNFQNCLEIILQSEGGYTNNPMDSGGPTSLGITLASLSQWEGRPATISEIQALTPATVAPIYEANYWRAAGCDSCAAGVDLLVFDMAVNQGVGRAIRVLQRVLGVPSDGVVGPQTRDAATHCSPLATINALTNAREALYPSYAAFPTFGKGWLTRLARTRAIALAMIQP